MSKTTTLWLWCLVALLSTVSFGDCTNRQQQQSLTSQQEKLINLINELEKCCENYGNNIRLFNNTKKLSEWDNQFMDHFKRTIVDELDKLDEASIHHPELALNHETINEKIEQLEQWTTNLITFAKQMIDEKKISLKVYRWITTASSYLFSMDEKYQKMFSMFKEDKTIEKQDNQPNIVSGSQQLEVDLKTSNDSRVPISQIEAEPKISDQDEMRDEKTGKNGDPMKHQQQQQQKDNLDDFNRQLSEYSNSIDESTTKVVQLNKDDKQFMDQFQQLVDNELQYLKQFSDSDYIDAKIKNKKVLKLEKLTQKLTKFINRMNTERKISNAEQWVTDMFEKVANCMLTYQQFDEINNDDEENSNVEDEENSNVEDEENPKDFPKYNAEHQDPLALDDKNVNKTNNDDVQKKSNEEEENPIVFAKYNAEYQNKDNNLDDTKEDGKLINSPSKRRFSEQYWTNELQKIVPIKLKWMIGILVTLLTSAGLVGLDQRFHLIDKIKKYLRGNSSSARFPMDKVFIDAHFTTRNSSSSSDILPKLALTVGVIGLAVAMAVVYWRYRHNNNQLNRQKQTNNNKINEIPTTITTTTTTTTSADTMNKSASKKFRISRKKPRKSGKFKKTTNQRLKTPNPRKKSTNRSKTARMISSNNNNVISNID